MNIELYNDDCLIKLKELPEGSIDLVLTDPPYGTNYGKVIGDESLDAYLKSLPLIFKCLKLDRFFICYCYPLYIPDIIYTAEGIGFDYRWVGFNYYPNMFKQKPQPLGYNRYDCFLIFSIGNPVKYNNMKDVVHILMDNSNNEERGHPHQKPEKAIRKIILATTQEGDTVLDPFMGSGVVGSVCKEVNRNFIGIEIDKVYFDLAKKRINNRKVFW